MSTTLPFKQGFGGAETFVARLIESLARMNIALEIIGPEGTGIDGASVHTVAGTPNPLFSADRPDLPIVIEPDSLCERAWDVVRKRLDAVDFVLSSVVEFQAFALTGLLKRPLLHHLWISSMNAGLDRVIGRTCRANPFAFSLVSHAQARTYGLQQSDPYLVLRPPLRLSDYTFTSRSSDALVWAGRVVPEKGLDDAAAVASKVGRRLLVAGPIIDPAYWRVVNERWHDTIDYQGHLSQPRLQQLLGSAAALLCTTKVTEAFGIVVTEALACGTPVIAYARGGPLEILDAAVGVLTPPDDIDAMAAAVDAAITLDRAACRALCERLFDTPAFDASLRHWLTASGAL